MREVIEGRALPRGAAHQQPAAAVRQAEARQATDPQHRLPSTILRTMRTIAPDRRSSTRRCKRAPLLSSPADDRARLWGSAANHSTPGSQRRLDRRRSLIGE